MPRRAPSERHAPATPTTRRDLLLRAGAGFGALPLLDLLRRDGSERKADAPPPRAKAVIWLFMYGGPSAIDLFDPKPTLDRLDGNSPPAGVDTFFKDNGNLMRSPYRFRRHGQSGQWVASPYPALARVVDRLAFVKSVHCASNNHAPALLHLNTGQPRVGFPSTGSWLSYGLGAESADLPGFVVMYDWRGGPIAGPQNWGAGFLPSEHQGVPLRTGGSPILNLDPPPGVSRRAQRAQLELLAELNRAHADLHPAEPELEARIKSYELAFRMQAAAPEAIDLRHESAETERLYGLDREVTRFFGTQCLIARRLVERGVRFVQIYSGGGHQQESWDAHFGLKPNHDLHCAETDVPMAGLIEDLHRRGLLDQTLVVWGGEFGRMPMSQGDNRGRDHNPQGFCMWFAGGGIRGGASHGETDDIGLNAVVDPVSVNDVHATILHQLGIDHEQLTYLHNGRRFRLTDVAGQVIAPILA
ncbi:MAG: DUF1501 domain-containing protein [Planctomycetota bacterium]